MSQLATFIVTTDPEFERQVARLLRSGGVPVGILDEGERNPAAADPDLAVVDVRADLAGGLGTIERLRSSHPMLAILALAVAAEPDAILQTMRAGANEFLVWPAATGTLPVGLRSLEEAFYGAVRRAATRRDAAQAAVRSPSVTLVFMGAKGGAGTTTMAVNTAVDLARVSGRPTLAVDLKPGLGEVALFLGVRPRFTVIDALENLHRLDQDFLRELVARHKSRLDVLAGADQFDRPGASDAGAIEELFRVLARIYDFIVVDAGNAVSACAVAAMYAADRIYLIANPDVPSVRNAQRLVDRVRQVGVSGERVRVLLNRASGLVLISPQQIEKALGYTIDHTFASDYRTVAEALNAGVPLTLTHRSEIAAQFEQFTRRIVAPPEQPRGPAARAERKVGLFGRR